MAKISDVFNDFRTLGRSDVRTLGRPDVRTPRRSDARVFRRSDVRTSASGRPDAQTLGRLLSSFFNFWVRRGEGPTRAERSSRPRRAAVAPALAATNAKIAKNERKTNEKRTKNEQSGSQNFGPAKTSNGRILARIAPI